MIIRVENVGSGRQVIEKQETGVDMIVMGLIGTHKRVFSTSKLI